ncbi:MAG: hypothetical protein Q8O54_00710 [Brevundimonas sp.]|nr:hypothetical protein [Brevundimonas sp.]
MVNALMARKDEDEVRQKVVDHSISYLRFGERPVFVCPLTGAPPAAGQRPGADLLYVSEGWQAVQAVSPGSWVSPAMEAMLTMRASPA